jgi:TnpA family transposase
MAVYVHLLGFSLLRITLDTDKLLRQHIYQALYKGEARNDLSRAVCIHRLGRIHDRSLQEQ